MGYIIRGDPNRDAVSRNDPDMMTAHFPTEFGKDLHIIICQCHRVPVAFADIRDRSFDLDQQGKRIWITQLKLARDSLYPIPLVCVGL
jgi:hypothetical protein